MRWRRPSLLLVLAVAACDTGSFPYRNHPLGSSASLAQGTEQSSLVSVLDEAAMARLMDEAAAAGNARAMVNRAMEDYWRNRPRFDEMTRAAAARGDLKAQVNLGVRALQDDKPDEARRWFEQAMAQGDASAMAYYGYMFEQGLGGLPKDLGRAAQYFRMARDHGSPLGERFLEDLGQRDRIPWPGAPF